MNKKQITKQVARTLKNNFCEIDPIDKPNHKKVAIATVPLYGPTKICKQCIKRYQFDGVKYFND